MAAQDLIVCLGRYNLKLLYERDALHEFASDILIHPDWKGTTLSYDADIALITMKNEIRFTPFIRPICFPPESDLNFNVQNAIGTVVRLQLDLKLVEILYFFSL